MASISTDPAGNRTVQFVGADRRRRSVRLGRVPMRAAAEVCRRVEQLNAARITGTALDTDAARWLSAIDVALARKLAAVGLVGPRPDAGTLGQFTREYIDRRTDVRPNTRKCLEQARGRLVEFFGEGRALRDVTEADADEFAFRLRTEYSEATATRAIRYGRQFFTHAVRGRVVAANPFTHVKAGSMENRERMYYVSQEDTQKLLAACPDVQWRLIVSLARYGGLRTPSETLALSWECVMWDQGKVRVPSPKTRDRLIPLFAELAPYLQEAWDAAEPGEVYVVNRTRNPAVNWRTQFQKIVKRAGLSPWERLFQNLRASREQDLTQSYPLPIVVEWLGNSIEVASRHYLKATDADFQRAAKAGATALHFPVQSVAVTGRLESAGDSERSGKDESCGSVTSTDDPS